MHDDMYNSMMMEQMHMHHNVMYSFSGLVILGLVIVIIFQYLALKELRKR